LQQLIRGKEVHDPPAVGVGLEQIVEVEGGFSEILVRTLLFQHEEIALDGADAGGGDVAILRRELPGVFPRVLRQGAEVFEIQEQEAALVGDLEDQIEHAGLGVIKL